MIKFSDRQLKTPKFIVVEILGAVRKPGVYKIENGKRLFDLIELAGGYVATAEKIKVNYFLRNGYTYFVRFTKFVEESDGKK